MSEISHLAHRLDQEDLLCFLLDLIFRFAFSWFDLTWHLIFVLVHLGKDKQSHLAHRLDQEDMGQRLKVRHLSSIWFRFWLKAKRIFVCVCLRVYDYHGHGHKKYL